MQNPATNLEYAHISLRMWQMAVWRDRPLFVNVSSACLLLAAVAGALLGASVKADTLAGLCGGAGIPLTVLAVMLWLRFVAGGAEQHSPANARLVPGLHRRMRRMAVLTWLVSLAPLVLIGVAIGQPLVVVAGSIALTALGNTRGGRASAVVVFIGIDIACVVVAGQPALLAWLSAPAPLTALALASLAYAWYALNLVFPQAGDGHWALLDRQKRVRAVQDFDQMERLRLSSGARAPLYAMLLRRDLARPASRSSILLHALGPAAQPASFAQPLFWLLAASLLGGLLAVLFGLLPRIHVLRNNLGLVALFLLPLVADRQLLAAIASTRGEQALMRLAPLCPLPERLNRLLGQRFLVMSLLGWFAFDAALLGLMVVCGYEQNSIIGVGGLMLAALGLHGTLLRDYSGQDGAPRIKTAIQFIVPCALALVVVVVWSKQPSDAAWGASLAAVAVCSLTLIYSRWRAMLAAPPAFPAKRLAP